jgi:putative SOS response-associated peptidase YedK
VCGRFALNVTSYDLSRIFEVGEVDETDAPPRFNIAPMQEIAVVLAAGLAPEATRRDGANAKNRLARFRWGLVPSWAKDPSIGNKMINARAETIAEKPSFRSAIRRRRCLVAASGFYEWDKVSGSRQPYWIHLAGGGPLAMAGIWESWRSPEGAPLETCAIVTTEANALVAPIHDRMPVILPKDSWDRWLGATDAPAVLDLLRPLPAEAMAKYPVSRHVNNPRNDDPRCLERADPGAP